MRLWIASTDYSSDIVFSRDILKRTTDAYRRIRNTARFLVSNLAGFDPSVNLVAPEDMLSLDRWALDRTLLLQHEISDLYDNYQFVHAVQKIHHFCALDMGGFYLDIIKDRQYTTQEDSLPRRSAQTALYHVLQALVRWIAPVLSYTADELWQYLPAQNKETVFTETWYEGLTGFSGDEPMAASYWSVVQQVKDAVNKALEEARKENKVGGSLTAEVVLYCDAELKGLLEQLGEELRFVTLTSSAALADYADGKEAVTTDLEGLRIQVIKSENGKCARCWHQREDVGSHTEHDDLCGRCIDNVYGDGEVRHFA